MKAPSDVPPVEGDRAGCEVKNSALLFYPFTLFRPPAETESAVGGGGKNDSTQNDGVAVAEMI